MSRRLGNALLLLAVIALCLGTTVLIKSGKARYAAVTVAPMIFLAAVTFTAGWMKIFSAKAAGFLPSIDKLKVKLAAAAPEQVRGLEAALFNARLDVVITTVFLILVAVIIGGCALEWMRILRGTKVAELHEAPYQSLPEQA